MVRQSLLTSPIFWPTLKYDLAFQLQCCFWSGWTLPLPSHPSGKLFSRSSMMSAQAQPPLSIPSQPASLSPKQVASSMSRQAYLDRVRVRVRVRVQVPVRVRGGGGVKVT